VSALSVARSQIATNPEQWRAFTATGHCLVTAPPGSGKTELLTARLAQDFIDTIHAPHGAACITYSNTAASELRRRLDHFGVEHRSNLVIGTVHSFALNHIIRPFAAILGSQRVANARVATEAQRDDAFERAQAAVYGDEDPGYGLRTTMDRRRRHFGSGGSDVTFGGESVAEVASMYESYLDEAGLIDFDGIVKAAVKLAESDKVVREVLAARFTKLYIDEYQDLGAGLHELVKVLCFDQAANAALFAVADPDQCIYVFSGASPELVEEIADRSDVEHVKLRLNYRCSDEIIAQSRKLLPSPIDVEGFREGGTVQAHQVDGKIAGQAERAVGFVRAALDAGSKAEDVAILCLSNADCIEVGDILHGAGIPVFVRRDDDYPRTPATQLMEMAAAWATAEPGQSGVTLKFVLGQWRQLLGGRWTRAKDVALTSLLLAQGATDDPPARDFVAAILELGLDAALRDDRLRAEDTDGVAQLLASVADGHLSGLTVTGLGDRAFARNRVHVLTMHSSKGLEFDLVCLLGLEHTRLPRFNAAEWEKIQDRRKFYVAITRGRFEVHMFYTGWLINKYGKRWDHGPSTFVKQLGL
jgi:DNA helicase II / ATP-dependent DNA helicase PcrA